MKDEPREDELVNLFDALYTRFILRDLIAKTVPGMILLSVMAISLTSLSSVHMFVASMSSWYWIAIFGVSWILTIGVQEFAEKCKLIRYYPEGMNREQYNYNKIQLNEVASSLDRQQVERFIVIKEACGNSCTILSISLLLLVVDGFLDTYSNGIPLIPWISSELLRIGHLFIVLIGIIYFLRKMHFVQVKQEAEHIRLVLKHNGLDAASGNWDVASIV